MLAVGAWIVAQRLQGITTLAPWGVFALFTGVVLGVAGVSLFLLGAMFNYLVALFYKRPIRQGLFGKPIFQPIRSTATSGGWGCWRWLGGGLLAVVSLAFSLDGWPMTRLWLWQLLAAMSAIIGLQLLISWFIMRVLEELSQREHLSRARHACDGEASRRPPAAPAASVSRAAHACDPEQARDRLTRLSDAPTSARGASRRCRRRASPTPARPCRR